VVVGVNKYKIEEDTSPEILKVDEATERTQLDRLERTKEERDDDAVDAALDDLADAIEGEENVMPAIVAAVKEYATMGEIMAVFEDAYGAYSEQIGLA